MANDKQKPAAKKERKYEVVRTVNLGGGDIRKAGQTVLESELDPKDLRELIGAGSLRDGDAPIPPSQAEAVREVNRLISIAKKIGVITQDGGDYVFGEKRAQGLTAFRELVTADELEKAIVDKATE